MWCERDARYTTLYLVGTILAVAIGIFVAYIDYVTR